MSDVLKEFLVSIGFAADAAEAAKVEATIAKTEQKITATATAEAAKRQGTEAKTGEARLTIAEALTRLLSIEEQKLSDAREKTSKGEAEKDEKRQLEAAKKSTERREAAVKQAQTFAVNMAALASKLVLGMTAAATGVLYAVDRAASGMERMKYAASWAGSSVKEMNGFVYAATQLGDSMEDAQASLAKFGDNLKTIPSFEGRLKNMGIATRDASGNLRDSADLAAEAMGKLKALPKLQREAMGGALGLSEQTLRVGVDPSFQARRQEYARDQAAVGADQDDAAKSGTAFEQSMRRLKETLDAIATRVKTGLFKQLQPELDTFQKWFSEHGDRIAGIADRIAKALIAFAKSVIKDLGKVDWDKHIGQIESLATGFDKIARALTGNIGATVAIGLFGAAIASKVLGPLVSAVTLLRALSSGAGGLARLMGLGGGAKVAATGAVEAAGAGAAGALGAGAAAILAGGAAAGAMKSPMVDEYGRVIGNWGDANDPNFEANRPTNPGTNPGTGTDADAGAADAKSSGGFWSWLKGKVGFGSDDTRVRDAVLSTAEDTKRLKELAERGGGEGGNVTVNASGGANIGRGAPNLRYGRRAPESSGSESGGGTPSKGHAGTYRQTPIPDAPYNGKSLDGLTEAGTKQYAAILGNRESGNRYGITNPYGYVGRWQMGEAALNDTGYMKTSIASQKRNSSMNDPNAWTGKGGVHSVEEFKANKGGVQDTEFGEYTNQHYAHMKSAGVIRDGMNQADVAGWLAAAHLKGVGGAISLARGHDNVDANGTSASSYKRMMAGVGRLEPGSQGTPPESRGPGASPGEAAREAATRSRTTHLLRWVHLGARVPSVPVDGEAGRKAHDEAVRSVLSPERRKLADAMRKAESAPHPLGVANTTVEIPKPIVTRVKDFVAPGRPVTPPPRIEPTVEIPKPAPVPSAEAGYAREHNAGRPQVLNMPGASSMLPAGRLNSGPVKVEIIDSSAAKIGEHVGKATLSQRQSAAVQQRDRALGEKTDRLNREATDRAKLSPERQKLADAMNTDAAKRHAFVQHLAELGRHGKLDLAHMMRSRHPLGVTPSASIDLSRNRTAHLEKHETFNIHGGDPRAMMAEAKRMAGRGNADLMRNLNTTEV